MKNNAHSKAKLTAVQTVGHSIPRFAGDVEPPGFAPVANENTAKCGSVNGVCQYVSQRGFCEETATFVVVDRL
jgi:hypothetical protein